jgi:hypothetical protein
VTIVLDSCHSGGATRGSAGAVKRGIESIDPSRRATDSLVATDAELAAAWRTASQAGTRAVKPGSGWLLEPQGYTLLAACRAQEAAYEYPFDGVERNGALTYWLLDSLKQLGPGLSYTMLHNRIVAKVHGQFEQQTPQLQGVGDRTVFGSDSARPFYAVPVMRVEASGARVLLGAGQAQGVRKGAQFAIYPSQTITFAQTDKRLALVDVDVLGATESWASLSTRLRDGAIEQGAPAVLLDPGTVRLQRPVRLAERKADLPAAIDQQVALAALTQVRTALVQNGSGFARLVEGDEAAVFEIAVNEQGQYEIWDAAGQVVQNLRPPLSIADPNAPAKLVQRLVHLAKYRNVQELDNQDAMSPLARKLVVEIAGRQTSYDPVDAPDPQPFDRTQGIPVLAPGEWLFIRLKNTLPKVPGAPPPTNVLNITVLNLQSDWGINQVYPSGPGSLFEPLDPGEERLLPLQASLPDAYDKSTDIVKVFATVGTTSFRWLELPPLDQPIPPRLALRSVQADPLVQLLAAVIEDEPRARNLNPATYPSKEWVTAQVEVYVRRQMTAR